MEKKVLLSVQDLVVKFHVRGRVLTAIRGISLDIYENESIAIVGESGSGKSVFTKTFSNMLDSNCFIDKGKIIFSDESLANFTVRLGGAQKRMISEVTEKLNEYSKLENGAEIYKQMKCLESEARQKASLSDEERAEIADKLEELRYEHAEAFNLKQTLDSKHDKDKIRQINAQLSDLSKKINELEAMEKATVKQRAAAAKKDHAYQAEYDKKMAQLKEKYTAACATPVTQAQRAESGACQGGLPVRQPLWFPGSSEDSAQADELPEGSHAPGAGFEPELRPQRRVLPCDLPRQAAG